MTRRTYWHLESLGRKPSDYEIVSSRLLYHPQRGFEVKLPAAEWYARYQKNSPFGGVDWEQFRDPRETTYTRYTTLQNAAEIHVDKLLQVHEAHGHDGRLAPEWLAVLERIVPVLRFPAHGLQMAAAYFAQMAPASRIVITGLFQTADEIRRVQRLAYRMRQLQLRQPGFGDGSRTAWEQAPEWQPLRRLIEHLLVTWDWGEAFIALNFAVRPVFDELFLNHFAQLARAHDDDLLEQMFFSLHEDSLWQRQWSADLLQLASTRPENREVARQWSDAWLASALEAAAALRPLFEAADCKNYETMLRQIEAGCREPLKVTEPIRTEHAA
jgi:toluene monooxygenase system protein E